MPFLVAYVTTRFLDEDEGWKLFLEKVFSDRQCPTQLWKIGRRIVENCEGLPLTIIAIAEHLSKAEKTVDYWNSVAENPNPLSIGVDDQTQTTETLLLTYKHLCQHLKSCFLYMAIFLRNCDILGSQLGNFWRAEGFVGPHAMATDYLEEFVNNSVVFLSISALVVPKTAVLGYHVSQTISWLNSDGKFFMPDEMSRNWYLDRLASERSLAYQENFISGDTNTYKIHSTYWHVCVSEAQEAKAFPCCKQYWQQFSTKHGEPAPTECLQQCFIWHQRSAQLSGLYIKRALSPLHWTIS